MSNDINLSLFQSLNTMANAVRLDESASYDFDKHHSIPQISRSIAQIMGLPAEQINGLRLGATLLDFGIVNIPAEIVYKPEKLTEQEYDIIKQHPVQGYQLLKMIDYPWPIARMVLQHHERIDGSGYPAGLKKDDIIQEARIIAVADVVHSITSNRPWRSALSINVALDEIEKNKGIIYDQEVVEACVELYIKQPERLTEDYYKR